jgi:hypothetical protein
MTYSACLVGAVFLGNRRSRDEEELGEDSRHDSCAVAVFGRWMFSSDVVLC